MQKNRHAFTLVELLVVVLIIGVLSAIAIPMYQGAVDKSHWSTMLPGAKAIKDAEEAIKMTNGAYTDEMVNLDVTMNNSDLTFALVTPNNTADPNVIRVTNSKLDNVRLASYLDDSPMFAGQLHCEAKTGDERAERLCGKLLNGQDLTSADGYVGYLLDQEIDQASCDNASRSWSSSKTKCFNTTAERCETLGMSAIAGHDQCGYQNQDSQQIKKEGICMASNAGTCMYSIVEEGGKCIAQTSSSCGYSTIKNGGICKVPKENNSWGCNRLQIQSGGICISNGDSGATCAENGFNGSICVSNGKSGCLISSFTNGGICYGNIENSGCSSPSVSYDPTSCCCGNGCGSKPKCADRGITCDPYYMDKNNFLD